MEASCIAGKEGGVGVYSPELERERERERERENSDLLNSMPLFQKRASLDLALFSFFLSKTLLAFSPSRGPSSPRGKVSSLVFFFLRKTHPTFPLLST